MIVALTPTTDGVVLVMAAVSAACAGLATGLLLDGHRRLAVTTALTSALVAFFCVWTAFLDGHRSAGGLALFVGAVALFRLMNFYERRTDDP